MQWKDGKGISNGISNFVSPSQPPLSVQMFWAFLQIKTYKYVCMYTISLHYQLMYFTKFHENYNNCISSMTPHIFLHENQKILQD